jgi:protein-S-isoprenylcysteine O-methyltransferase Ste14
VPGGFVLVVAFAWLARPDWNSLMIGVPVSVVGLALRAWAAGHLAKNQELATGGPYGYIRNPLYIGTLIVATGILVSAQRWELVVLFAAVFGLIYLPVIELEEQHLRKLFPAFRDYCDRVPMLFPRGRRMASTQRFKTALYWRNEEYNAALGYLVGLAWLIWKSSR